jgi:hypothetical protein
MSDAKLLEEYRTKVVNRLRSHELKKAQGDEARVREIQSMADGELLRKWMWLTVIVGGPICFVAVPFVLAILSTFVWRPVMGFLWDLARLAMGLVFMLFLFAIYFTTKKTNG